MLESDLNTIISNNLPFAFKIPDPVGKTAMFATQRPFDGFGIILQDSVSYPLYWESKFSNKLQSFNLSRIETHQAYNLTQILTLMPTAKAWVIFGVHAGHGDTRLYIFDWNYLKQRYEEKDNILKKELLLLPYNSVKKKAVTFTNVITTRGSDVC